MIVEVEIGKEKNNVRSTSDGRMFKNEEKTLECSIHGWKLANRKDDGWA